MTDETKRKRDELCEEICGDNFIYEDNDALRSELHDAFCLGFDAGYAEGQAEVAIHESKASQFESTLAETMRVRDEYKAKLDKAKAALERISSMARRDVGSDYCARNARQALTELEDK